MYLVPNKICLRLLVPKIFSINTLMTNKSCSQVGRERQRYDFDDYDVPTKFNI